jgi:proteasome component ECM29
LLSLSVKQSEDVLLTAGQALVEAVTGKVPPDSSTAILGANSADATVTSLSERHISLCHAIVDHTLRRPLVSIHAQERTAAAVWLLCIIHACGRIPSVLDSRLPIIQSAFIRLLGEKSEFAQESAANGLSVVYDCSPVSMRDALVHGMIDTFTTGRKSTDATLPSSATEDASGSETASVGAGPAGLALTAAGDSAYKELCAFANEVGQPDLIYRFLALSSHHASWHAKSGSSLVFEALLRSNARKEVCWYPFRIHLVDVTVTFVTSSCSIAHQIEPHLMKLVPRLYRYQYDPTPRVQDAMSRLWMVLVNDPKVVVTAQFEPILKELLRAMSAENWRERRAGCAGLTDLLSGRTFGEVSQYLAAMWAACLRAIDDIKDTVRADAMTTLKTLGKLTVPAIVVCAVSVREFCTVCVCR